MDVLIGCEYSGIVRDEFLKRGHNALSCDFHETEKPGPHYQGNILDLLDNSWDLFIVFPDCTYLCSSGLHWNKRIAGREEKTRGAIDFVKRLLNANINKIALENPVGRIGTAIRKADQYIQPYNFGHDASKKTGLWLHNLPPLKSTKIILPRYVNGKPRWANQTDSGQNRETPSPDRWKNRARTYQGIAEAMAEQWGDA